MSNFLKNMPVYQPSGTPSFGWIQLLSMPLVGDYVIINGDQYTFGTDFFGQSAAQALRSLVSAVRANQNEANEVSPTNTNFFRQYYAEFSGKYCVVFAVVPGPGGNAITLSTSNSVRIAISGATFTGGVSSNASQGIPTDAVSLAIVAGGTAQQVFAANPNRRYLIIQNQSNDPLWINFGAAATAAPPSIQIATNGGSYIFEGAFIPTGSISIIGATTGDMFSAKEA